MNITVSINTVCRRAFVGLRAAPLSVVAFAAGSARLIRLCASQHALRRSDTLDSRACVLMCKRMLCLRGQELPGARHANNRLQRASATQSKASAHLYRPHEPNTCRRMAA